MGISKRLQDVFELRYLEGKNIAMVDDNRGVAGNAQNWLDD
jgi:hypothetical protein